jgi:hypothetical protein
MVFNTGVTYGIYLLNPSNELPDLKLIQTKTGNMVKGEKVVNKEEKYTYFIFTIEESGQYKLSLNFNSKKKACVLFVLSFIGKDMEK